MGLSGKYMGKLVLVILSVMITYSLLHLVVVKTQIAGGIGLTELIADEYRILSGPTGVSNCIFENATHMRPGCEVISTGDRVRIPVYEVTINSAGFRGREYSVQKGEGIYRIAVLGDSFTFGEGVDDEETYSHVLETRLNELGGDKLIEVLNLGMSGGSTDTAFRILTRFQNYDPDLVILQTLGNDVHECDLFRKMARERFALERGEEHNEPDDSSGNLIWVSDIEYLSFIELADSLPMDEKCFCVRDYLEKILNLSADLHASVIVFDVYDEPANACFASGETDRYRYVRAGGYQYERKYKVSRKDGHPNAKGHRLMADDLMPVIQEEMNKAVGGVSG